jgi:hypothetical protein
MKVYGISVKGYYSCFSNSSSVVSTQKLFRSKESAEKFAKKWINRLGTEDDGFHGVFVTHGEYKVIEYDLEEEEGSP